MSNKSFDKLDRSDKTLRLSSAVGMESGVKQIILRMVGFEIFNTRPYHNYETWSDGYTVIGRRDQQAMSIEEAGKLIASGIFYKEPYLSADGEDLDEACSRFSQLQSKAK